MSETNAADLSARSWSQLILGVLRGFGRDRRALIAAGALALVLGAALNWSRLVAVSAAPLILGVLPCAVMCALGLCMMGMNRSSAGAPPTGSATDGRGEAGGSCCSHSEADSK